MSRLTYNVEQTYLGDGSLNEYTFDFKIEALEQLLIIVMDDSDVEVERVRGDDDTYLDSVTFDPVLGGGTVTLLANLPSGYHIVLLLANDEPTQPYLFNNKTAFSLRTIEKALDFIVGAVQRLTFRSNRSIKIHEYEDLSSFSVDIPYGVTDQPGKTLVINEDGDGFAFGDSASPALSSDITVTIPSQGQYNNGDVIPASTDLEEVIRNMLTSLTPPTFSLAGSGVKIVESGTVINPTLTPAYTMNDAGPANAYRLFKGGVEEYTSATPTAYVDPAFSIVDTSVSYYAEVDYDPSTSYPAGGTLTSNTITYQGARAAFFQAGGDPVNIRSNSETLVNVQSGSQLITTGNDTDNFAIFSYPDGLGDPTSLFLSNTGGNFDITDDLVRETDQSVNDASGGNAITYRVYSYTALIPIETADTLTLTI